MFIDEQLQHNMKNTKIKVCKNSTGAIEQVVWKNNFVSGDV